MTGDEAADAVQYLVAMTTGWNDDAAVGYVMQLARREDGGVLMEACQRLAREWTFGHRPPLAVIEREYDAVLAEHEERVARAFNARQDAIRCNGGGWYTNGDGEQLPCPTCAPAVARVWHDPDLLARYRHGEPLWLLVGCESAKDLRERFSRQPCVPNPALAVDPFNPVVDINAPDGWGRATAAARQAFIDDARAEGRVPNLDFFDRVMHRHLAPSVRR